MRTLSQIPEVLANDHLFTIFKKISAEGLLDLEADREMRSIQGHRRHTVEVFAQMPSRVVDLPILESSQGDL